MKKLKIIYVLGCLLSLLVGAGVEHEHAVFSWHRIPAWDAIFGVLGALLLLVLVKGVEVLVHREESFYD